MAKRTDTQACHHHPGTTRHGYWLLLILFLCGPLGTLLFFVLLPPDTHSTDETGPYELGTKIVHLALAGSSRRARYVLDEYTVWGTFLAGVRDRLGEVPWLLTGFSHVLNRGDQVRSLR